MTITDPRRSQATPDTPYRGAAAGNANDSRHSHREGDTQNAPAVASQATPQAVSPPSPEAETPAGSDRPRPDASGDLSPIQAPRPVVVDPLLFVHATAHGDLEQQRIASQNRLRILTTDQPDEDGITRGFGLDFTHPDVARLAGITDALARLEHDAELGLTRALRRCAIHPWIKTQVGLGEKQTARLLAIIGDPYWHALDDRPRTVSELWAYCGLHVLPARQNVFDTQRDNASVARHDGSDPGQIPTDDQTAPAGVAARRQRGVKANWSTEAKTRAYLIATSCVKQATSPYRTVYVARRAHTADTHPDWTPGHSHNDALRITSKRVLRDLWREARRLHLGVHA